MTVPDEGFQIRKLPIPDDAVAERLTTTSQRKLADELGVSRRAVRLAADRHRVMQALPRASPDSPSTELVVKRACWRAGR